MASVSVGSASPATSPRLPSPPPFPEVQLPPKSPGISAPSLPENTDSSKPSNQPLRRIRPGTRAADMSSGPPLIPLSELDSPFQLQEHLKSLHAHHTRSTTSPTATQPLIAATAREIAKPPPTIDRNLWLYELTRFLVLRANDIIVSFFRETPPCSASTCPEMRASEWQYLCAVHEPPKPCCAIDYSCHTLDWAAYVLTSQKHFPSRLKLGHDDADAAGGGTQLGLKQLTNIMRRVYRIFAHAWFQHREVFWEIEGREGLYIFFKTVCDEYDLVPEDNCTIPSEAEGLSGDKAEKKRPQSRSPEKKARGAEGSHEDDTVSVSAGPGATQRRHKATPSLGSAVATIQEGDEEDIREGKSPAKEKQGGLVDKMAKSVLGETPTAPLAAISKTAEKKEEEFVKEKEQAWLMKTEQSADEQSKDGNRQEREEKRGLARSKSSDSVATQVKVEEKEIEDQ